MSEAAKINLVGVDKETLLANIAKIRDWDNGKNYPIIVIGNEGKEHMDTIDNVWAAINDDKIEEYLNSPQKPSVSDIDLSPKKPEAPKLDSIYKGSINFEIRWYGNQAEIVVEDPDFYKRAAMLQQIHLDMGNLLEEMKNRPKKEKGGFDENEKRRVISARHLLDKFINSYLGNIWMHEHQQPEYIDPRKAGDPVEENEIAEELPKEDPTSNLTVVKNIENEK